MSFYRHSSYPGSFLNHFTASLYVYSAFERHSLITCVIDNMAVLHSHFSESLMFYIFFFFIWRIFSGLWWNLFKIIHFFRNSFKLEIRIRGMCIKLLFATVLFSHEVCYLFMHFLFSVCDFLVAIPISVCDLSWVFKLYF